MSNFKNLEPQKTIENATAPQSPQPTLTTTPPNTVIQRAIDNPYALSFNEVMQLHKTIGNQAVAQLFRKKELSTRQKTDTSQDTNNAIQRAKKSKKSGKEKASDIPSWARGETKLPGESGKQAAHRVLAAKYGEGNYETGPKSEFNKLKKFFDRKDG